MQDPVEMTDGVMLGLAAQITAYLRRHEVAVHGGDPCMRNRASAVGYVAHVLGVQSIHEIRDAIEFYALHCPNCTHERN